MIDIMINNGQLVLPVLGLIVLAGVFAGCMELFSMVANDLKDDEAKLDDWYD